MFTDLRERERKGARRERHQCGRKTSVRSLPYAPQPGIEPATVFCVWDNAPTNWATQPGHVWLLFKTWVRYKQKNRKRESQMKSYSIKLCGVKWQMLLLCWKTKDGELTVGFGTVKVIGDCDSRGFDHHLWRSLETCLPAQTYSIRNKNGPSNPCFKNPLCDSIA